MAQVVMPSYDQLNDLLSSYTSGNAGLCFVIGCAVANPDSSQSSQAGGSLLSQNIYYFGAPTNQFGQPMSFDNSTQFLIASLTKTFTATAYAKLFPNQTSYTLSNSFPQLPDYLGEINLYSLANYSSGLPQDNLTDQYSTQNPPVPYSRSAMLSYLNTNIIQLGKDLFYYSNLGFALLAEALAVYSNSKFGDLLKDLILYPLGMQSVFFEEANLKAVPLAYTYDYNNNTSYTSTNLNYDLFPAYHGGGGLVSTPNDMMTWLIFNMGWMASNPLYTLLSTTQSSITSTSDFDVGLGWFINPAVSGGLPETVTKNGELPGATSYMLFASGLPSTAGVFVLANADGMTTNQSNGGPDLVESIATSALQIMFGQQPSQIHYPSAFRRRP